MHMYTWFPWWLSGKESVCQAGDMGLIPGLGRFPREGNGNPLQYSCLGNPMDRGTWRATVHRVAKSQTQLTTKQQYVIINIHIYVCIYTDTSVFVYIYVHIYTCVYIYTYVCIQNI